LEVLIATVQQLLQKRKEEAHPRQNERRNNRFRCEEPGHFIKDCISKKVLATWDLTRK